MPSVPASPSLTLRGFPARVPVLVLALGVSLLAGCSRDSGEAAPSVTITLPAEPPQGPPLATPAEDFDPDPVLEEIRTEYRAINEQLDGLDSLRAALRRPDGGEPASAEGIGETLEVWYDAQDRVRKILHHREDEEGWQDLELYLHHGEVFFAVELTYRYRVAPTEKRYDPEKHIQRTQQRFYLHQGHLFRWLDEDRKRVDPTTVRWKRRALDLHRQIALLKGCLEDLSPP